MTGPGPDDQNLVRASQRGERAAFEELVRRSARLIFARVYLETGDVHRAEDLVQETFLLAWRSIRDVSDPKDFRAWLGAIAHRVVIDAARRESRKKRSRRSTAREELDEMPDRAPTPDAAAESNEERNRVLSILRSMPEEYRAPLMLRYLAGADYDTIARQLALSNGSLRGLLHRGMKMLRDQVNRGE